jgi:hypothetical protein
VSDRDVEQSLDGALDALVNMRPADIVAAQQNLQAILHSPLSPAALSKVRRVSAAAMQSAHLWYMCSTIQGDKAGYSNDGLWTPQVCAPEISVKG